MIAFLGTGLLGTGFVRAFLRRGESVQVFNRTASKAKALEAHGAKAFDSAAEAVRGAERVHVLVSDDAAVDEVLASAKAALAPGTIILDHTTTSAAGTRGRVERFDREGLVYVHAPVFMGPQNALESTGIILVSGERTRVEKVKPWLAPMTGKVVDLGEDPTRGASFKLLGNLFLMFINGGLAEVFTLARALAIDPREAAALFQQFNPGASVPARAERMLSADYANPSWELGMARKDARLMIEAATSAGAELRFLPAIAGRMDELIGEGHAHDDWTVLGIDAVKPPKP